MVAGSERAEYFRSYKAVRRNLGYYLSRVIREADEPLRSSGISKKLYDDVGVWIRRPTLEGLLRTYKDRLGVAPLKAVGYPTRGPSARYSLNDNFYQRFEVLPSHGHGEGVCRIA